MHVGIARYGTAEIAKRFLHQPIRETLSVLVHEMVHLWQQHNGKPVRSGYHNREWADKMKEIGLHPSNTGERGGKEVGQQMRHYIVEDGAFAAAFEVLASDGFRLTWGELSDWIDNGDDEGDGSDRGEDKNRSNRVKYTCPACDVNVWGKPNLPLICGKCQAAFRFDNIPHEAGARR